jgi:invasion protein IalB
MKKSLFFVALAVSAAASAQAPSSSGASEGGANPNQVICRTQRETGTLLGRVRICKTRTEWEAQRRETRQTVDRAQTNRVNRGE